MYKQIYNLFLLFLKKRINLIQICIFQYYFFLFIQQIESWNGF